ncbi:mannitol dehydrogenase family protein [Pelagibacterium sp. 26DY04]|uniref:mannitol dehydrogenase family protein n=1 Tax=Pelagibacterium sp. 26DY04 TaxID=2967130 RepID=UPI002815466C|nr:mannitol dehydrogenase family protein [Pelagibacterium sp. 26DY04]WMT85489.1 mannitol dehydrogenase family protein [Pelagibacterium sp. 26DY04]
MFRLDQASLANLAPDIQKPVYDRAGIRPGIVHIGIGAFHRGHMAVYIDDVLERDPNWAIIGASIRRPDTRDALAPQDHLYSVSAKSGEGISTRVIGSIVDIIDASASTRALIARMAEPRIRIVSLTVTEKGYCHDPANGHLSTQHPDIVNDAIHPDTPRSVPAIIVAAAALRRAGGHGGLTVLSCDNLQGNGKIAKTTVLEFARLRDASLAEWIEANFSFPSTMVDRIVPAISDGDKQDVEQRLGLADAWPVVTEPFSQWVIEDHFAAGRPDLTAVSAQLVPDVEPFELMKLRMLNGSHSTMAYLGQLAGHRFVSDAVADETLKALVSTLMTHEVIPTLDVQGIDLFAYRDALLRRFANPALRHQLAQIAVDGSQKLPQRTVTPIRERLAHGKSIELLCLTLAGWIAYLARLVRQEGTEPADAMAARLADVVKGEGSASELVRKALSITEIFGDDMVNIEPVVQTVERHLACLQDEGVGAAIHKALARIDA